MGKLSRRSRKRKLKVLGEPQVIEREEVADLDVDSRLELIRSLIPLGLMYVGEELEREVLELAGARYRRKDGIGNFTVMVRIGDRCAWPVSAIRSGFHGYGDLKGKCG